MNKGYDLYKSVFFYITCLLKNKNITESLLLPDIEALLDYKNKTSVKEFDYSSIRVAASRIIVLSFIDLEETKATSLLSLLGLAATEEKELQKQIINLLKEEAEFVTNIQSKFIDFTSSFLKTVTESELFTIPILEKNMFESIKNFFKIKENESLLDSLLEKRGNLRLKVDQKEDLNLKVITDFYSPITTSPFAFQIVERYNDFLRPVVEEVIKYKHIYNLFEIIATFKITNWILTEKWEE